MGIYRDIEDIEKFFSDLRDILTDYEDSRLDIDCTIFRINKRLAILSPSSSALRLRNYIDKCERENAKGKY